MVPGVRVSSGPAQAGVPEMIALTTTERAVLAEMIGWHAGKWLRHARSASGPLATEAQAVKAARWALIGDRLANGEGIDDGATD